MPPLTILLLLVLNILDDEKYNALFPSAVSDDNAEQRVCQCPWSAVHTPSVELQLITGIPSPESAIEVFLVVDLEYFKSSSQYTSSVSCQCYYWK